jgi:hypothetical protein
MGRRLLRAAALGLALTAAAPGGGALAAGPAAGTARPDSVLAAPADTLRIPAVADSLAAPSPPGAPGAPEGAPLARPLGRRVQARSDTARSAGAMQGGRFDSPRWVMLRCLAFPGWGQFANHAWLKGIVIGGLDGYLRVRGLEDQRALRDLDPRVAEARGTFQQADQATAEALAALQAAQALGDSALIAQAEAHYRDALLGRVAAAAGYNSLAGSYNALLNGQVSRLWLLGGVLVYALVDSYVDAHFRNFRIEFQHDPALPGGLPPTGRNRLFLRWTF